MKRIISVLILLAALLAAPAALAVDINKADAAALAAALDGVGEKRAAAIVADREANGPFASVEDLKRVDGIGDGLLDMNRDAITVGE